MTTRQTGLDEISRDVSGWDGGPSLGMPAAILAIANLAALVHPHPLVLPVLSAVLVSGGAFLALFVAVRYRRARADRADRMALPALIVFFGFVAAVLSDTDRAAQSLAHLGV